MLLINLIHLWHLTPMLLWKWPELSHPELNTGTLSGLSCSNKCCVYKKPPGGDIESDWHVSRFCDRKSNIIALHTQNQHPCWDEALPISVCTCVCVVLGFLWGRGEQRVHLQRAEAHRAVGNLPEITQTLLRQVWSGQRKDDPGLQ